MIADSQSNPVTKRGNVSLAKPLRQWAATDSTPSQKPRTRVTAFGLAPRGSASARHARPINKEVVPLTRT